MPPVNPAITSAPIQTAQSNLSSATPKAAPKAQQSFQPSKPGGTYWPENKKRSLAEAARKALTTTEPNIGKQVTTDEIHELLNENPSYTQMCDILEYRGFVIDRGQLARLILSAVPDLGATNASSTAARPSSTVSAPPSNGPPPLPLQGTIRHSGPLDTAYTTPYPAPNTGPYAQGALQQGPTPQEKADGSKTTWNARDLSATADAKNGVILADTRNLTNTSLSHIADDSGRTEINRLDSLGHSIPQTPTKQDLARKRNFGDIVDLTQLSDDERPPQRPRLEAANLPNPSTVNGYGPAHIPPMLAAPLHTEKVAQQQGTSGLITATSAKDMSINKFRYKASGREFLWNEEVVRPMKKRQDALRRSSYGPKTIARDILVALGKHPTMRPLNAHLDVLRDRFQSVNYDSDLDTFRWDLVDPGGDPVPVQTAPILADGDVNDADDEDAVGLSGRSPITHHRSQISVVIGGGPVTTEGVPFALGEDDTSLGKDNLLNTPLDAGLELGAAKANPPRRGRGRPSRGGHIGSIVRSRTDGIESSSQQQPTSGQIRTGLSNQQQSPRYNPSTPRNETSDQGIVQNNKNDQNLSRFVYNAPSSMNTPNAASVAQVPSFDSSQSRTPASFLRQSNTPLSKPGSEKRIGRPPGAKNKKPRPDKGIPWKRTLDQTPNNSENPIPTRPRINTTTPAQPSGLRNAMIPTDNTAEFIGVRNAATPTHGITVVIPSRSPSVANTPDTKSTTKKRSLKMPIPSGRYPSQPLYQVYRCHWEKCPAELHNLETLGKHVRKHRGNPEEAPFPCLWANCYDSNLSVPNKAQDVSSGERERQHMNFESSEAWEKHMVGKHVNAIAWELGDGPATHSSGNLLIAYHLDSLC